MDLLDCYSPISLTYVPILTLMSSNESVLLKTPDDWYVWSKQLEADWQANPKDPDYQEGKKAAFSNNCSDDITDRENKMPCLQTRSCRLASKPKRPRLLGREKGGILKQLIRQYC